VGGIVRQADPGDLREAAGGEDKFTLAGDIVEAVRPGGAWTWLRDIPVPPGARALLPGPILPKSREAHQGSSEAKGEEQAHG
jgi:hypothetical protein